MRFSSAIPAFLLAITAPVQAWNRLDKDNAVRLLSAPHDTFKTNQYKSGSAGD
jgi:hypothetical protein